MGQLWVPSLWIESGILRVSIPPAHSETLATPERERALRVATA